MKKTLLLAGCLTILAPCLLFAQNQSLGVGIDPPNPNAVLHVESPTGNQGFIMPRLTTAQRTAPGFTGILTGDDNGLMVYDTNLNAIYIWNGSSWITPQGTGALNLQYPYADSVTSLPDSSTVFKIKYDGSSFITVDVAQFENTNMKNSGTVLDVSTNGTGGAGIFSVKNEGSYGSALTLLTYGMGDAFHVHHVGSSGNIASFRSDNTPVARIDKDGTGFFNGGTQNSGADIAELFEVEGQRTGYKPGDVLVISARSDRTVEKSTTANSTRVAGVYATRPGVVLTERAIGENTDDLIPMGVVGVIPTNVCTENGPIRRGDLLVTSSREGHAMKAVPVKVNGADLYPTGAIIGKALENFDTGETGRIKVLVNIK